MTLSRHDVFAFLTERPRVGRLATVTLSGAPRVVPVWFRVRHDRILVHTNPRMAKARNINTTGRFALAVDDDTWPYRGVSIWGAAHTADPADVVGDLWAFMHEIAVSYLGEKLGGPMGKSLSDPSSPQTRSSCSSPTDGWTTTTRADEAAMSNGGEAAPGWAERSGPPASSLAPRQHVQRYRHGHRSSVKPEAPIRARKTSRA